VEAKVGPDGAVWVLDWYNFIVQHNPTPSTERGGYDAENGEGNAYINPLRDKARGRIWRVVYKAAAKRPPQALDINNPDELVAALSNDNMFWRMTAQRLLVLRGKQDVFPDLYRLINNSETDALGLNPAALHALWVLEGLGAASDEEAGAVIKGALFHPSAPVRKATIQILPRAEWVDESLLLSDVLHDKDPGVQLAALLYFSERESSEQIGSLLYDLSQDAKVVNDRWLSRALYIAAGRHGDGFIGAYLKDHPAGKVLPSAPVILDEINLNSEKLAETLVQNYINKVGQLKALVSDTSVAGTKVIIKTIKNEMKYDISEFVVQAGKPVELVFENTDFMQHNLVIVAPGAKEKVGLAADKLAVDPNGAAINYVPQMDEVLFATAIIDPEEKIVLKFTAPAKAGNYPFICTFPGHWRIMQGVMKVVEAQ
jgi:azurin